MPPARVLLYLATAGVLVLTGRAILIAPPPLELAALALSAYVALILCGVFVLRLRLFVDAIVRGPKGARGVALTFDDGPDPKWTRRVLDALDAGGVKGTFFVIAKKAEAHPEVVREILARGHAIGLHSYAHDRFFSLRSRARVRADLEKGLAVLTQITGERPMLFRPPIGHTNPVIASVAEELDLVTVGWSVSARDGIKGASAEEVATRVGAAAEDRAIVLLHDAAERGDREPVAAAALPAILRALTEARLGVVPLEGWIERG